MKELIYFFFLGEKDQHKIHFMMDEILYDKWIFK